MLGEPAWEQDTWGFAEGDEIVPGRHAVRLLGGGRRYEAYLVWDDALYALAVAKVVRPGQAASSRTLAGMAGEAEALSLLAHPSLVRCFDAVLDGERPHLLLELLDGPRLSTLERRYGLAVEQLLPLALQLCSALHYMHGQGWAHLDVKPRNIIMSSTPKLIDLSVAQRFGDARETSSPIGTDAYMAPEQCDPARFGEIGPASDVYGLGATLRAALPERVPPALAAAVESCLEPRPADRPAAGELADVLEPMVDALPAPRLGRFRPSPRKRNPHHREVLR